MILFTADPHFGHANIIKHCSRPFESLEDMDATMIENWNKRAIPIDHVHILGDFCFTNTSSKGGGTRKKWFWYADQLNGYKHFYRGNHDSNNHVVASILRAELEVSKKKVFCTHRPTDIILGDYDLYLVGHVHEKWKHRILYDGYREHVVVNVGVDQWGFKPVSMDDILHYLREQHVNLP